MVTKIDDGDYELTDGCAWLSTKGFAIRIHTTDESVFVDIYKEVGTDQLYDAPLASAGANLQDANLKNANFEGATGVSVKKKGNDWDCYRAKDK